MIGHPVSTNARDRLRTPLLRGHTISKIGVRPHNAWRPKRRSLVYVAARRVRHVDDIDAVSRKVREDFLPIVRTVPGFVAYYLVDAIHSTFSITICQDEAGVEEAIARASEWTKTNLGGLVESPPEIIQGEVVVENLV
jgi:hypothetical protein